MDTGDLRTYLAFAHALSFTHAARAVHLSQPAVFAVVKRLADEVGAALYAKQGRALALTTAGQLLARHARDAVESERALLATVRGDDESSACVLACGEGALVHVVGPAVAAFARAHPKRLRVVVADGPAARDAVVRGEAHVAVVAGPEGGNDVAGRTAREGDDVVSRVLVKSRIVAAGLARAFDVVAHDGALSLADFARLPLILPPVGRPLRRSVDDALAAAGLAPNVAVEASGWEAVLALARLGCGVALVNDVVAARGLMVREVIGLAPVPYRTLARRRRGALAAELVRALHAER